MSVGLVQVLADGGPAGFSVLGQSQSLWVARGIMAAHNVENGPYLKLTTPGDVGAFACIESGEQWYCRGFGCVLSMSLLTGSAVTNLRLVAGCSEVPGAKMSAPIAHMAAWVYDTGIHGTAYWRTVTSDGSGTLTTTATALSISADTHYTLLVDFRPSGAVDFHASSGSSHPTLMASHATNLPSTTTRMRTGVWFTQLSGIA